MSNTIVPQPLLFKIIRFFTRPQKSFLKGKKKTFIFEKRQKFAVGVLALSLGLFFAAFAQNTYGLVMAGLLAVFTDLFLYWVVRRDLKDNLSLQVFILPFLYSLSFGFFVFLAPARLLIRAILTILYALGLYSVFLSENIFIISSIKTIALLNSARIVSLVISLIAYFFLNNSIISLRANIFVTVLAVFLFCILFTMHAIWAYTLEKEIKKDILWVLIVSICITELTTLLWFWPTSPTVVSLFLASIWYVLVGLSHVWLDKRLFRGVLWEFMWVAFIAFLVLITLTKWQ